MGKKTLINKLDKEISLQVRSYGQCQKCSKDDYKKLQCCHIFSRAYRSVRWDRINLLCLCSGCHMWSHRNPILFTEFVQEHLGKENYEELKLRAVPRKNWKESELKELYQSLTQKA